MCKMARTDFSYIHNVQWQYKLQNTDLKSEYELGIGFTAVCNTMSAQATTDSITVYFLFTCILSPLSYVIKSHQQITVGKQVIQIQLNYAAS